MNPKGIDNPPTKRSPKNSQRQHGPILGPSLNKLWLRGNFLQGPFACMGKYPTSSCVILKVFHFAISFGCMSSVMSRLSIHLLNVNHSWHLDIYIYTYGCKSQFPSPRLWNVIHVHDWWYLTPTCEASIEFGHQKIWFRSEADEFVNNGVLNGHFGGRFFFRNVKLTYWFVL